MSVVHLIFVSLFTFILLVNGSPVDSIEKYEIVVCPENGCKDAAYNTSIQLITIFLKIFSVLDGVVIYPREARCSRVGGMCVEKNKCKSLVSASGLCPISQAKGVECCFECKLMLFKIP